MTSNTPLTNEIKSDIQSFITSGLGHIYHSVYLFLRVDDKLKAKNWLANLEPEISSARSWRTEDKPAIGPDKEKEPKLKPVEFINLAFTMDGLLALGMPEEVVATFPIEFQQGMADATRALLLGDTGDSAPDKWEIGNPSKPGFHILLILNAGTDSENTADITAFADKNKQIIVNSGLSIAYEEIGYRRKDDKELFGFHDGIAQPNLQGINIYKYGKKIENPINLGDFVLGYANQYGMVPATPVINKKYDPANVLPNFKNPFEVDKTTPSKDLKDMGLHGTYIVYRKLVQDVASFWKFIIQEIERLDGSLTTADRLIWLASKMVGRKPNGDPVTPQSPHPKSQDDFLYAKDDAEGLFCPVGAHIRRSNPRDVFRPEEPGLSLVISDIHRIIRRGRNFGEPAFDLSELDNPTSGLIDTLRNLTNDKKRGLHFFCVNSSLQRQFEFIQQNWTNNPNFNGLYENKDPIIGDNDAPYQRPSYMHIPDAGIRIRTSKLPRFVSVYGGAYLFMPSKTVLKWLGQA